MVLDCPGVATGVVPEGVCAGVAEGVCPGVAEGVCPGVAAGVPAGVEVGVATGVADADPAGLGVAAADESVAPAAGLSTSAALFSTSSEQKKHLVYRRDKFVRPRKVGYQGIWSCRQLFRYQSF